MLLVQSEMNSTRDVWKIWQIGLGLATRPILPKFPGNTRTFNPDCTHNRMITYTGTVFSITGTRRQRSKIHIDLVKVGRVDIYAAMNIQVRNISRKAFRGQFNIRQICEFLSLKTMQTLISYIRFNTYLDYCNSLLFISKTH